MRIQLDKGVELETLKIEPDDIIILRIDADIVDLNQGRAIFDVIRDVFPDNKIVTIRTGIDIDIQHEYT